MVVLARELVLSVSKASADAVAGGTLEGEHGGEGYAVAKPDLMPLRSAAVLLHRVAQGVEQVGRLSLHGPRPTRCCIRNTLASEQAGIRVVIVTRCINWPRHGRTICASSSAITPRQWRMSSLTLGQSNGVRGFLCKAVPCRTWLPACFWLRAHPHHSPKAQCLRGSPRGLAAQAISTFSSGLTGHSGWGKVGGCA